MTALVVALTLAVGLLGLLVAGLLRSHAEILRTLHELGAGLESTGPASAALGAGGGGHDHRHEADFGVRDGLTAPRDGTTRASDISGATPGDEAVAIAVVGASHDTLVAFLSSGCLTCAAFWSAFADPRLELPRGTRLVVVTRGEEAESPSALRELAPPGLAVVMSTETWEAYDVPGSPYFVHVEGPTGRVLGEGTASGWPQVAELLRQADGDARDRSGRPRRLRTVAELAGPGDGPHREARADAELLAAGITPGHPSLYPAPSSADAPEAGSWRDAASSTGVGDAPSAAGPAPAPGRARSS